MKSVAHKTAYGYEYKGKAIRKHTFCEMTYWRVNEKEFSTLRQAKEYIDSLEA